MHCHPLCATLRYARCFAATNDSHYYSPRPFPRESALQIKVPFILRAFLRLGERAPTKRDKGTVILRVPLRASRVVSQLRMTVTIILRAF
jgi:hypothetical protein